MCQSESTISEVSSSAVGMADLPVGIIGHLQACAYAYVCAAAVVVGLCVLGGVANRVGIEVRTRSGRMDRDMNRLVTGIVGETVNGCLSGVGIGAFWPITVPVLIYCTWASPHDPGHTVFTLWSAPSRSETATGYTSAVGRAESLQWRITDPAESRLKLDPGNADKKNHLTVALAEEVLAWRAAAAAVKLYVKDLEAAVMR